MCHLPRSIVLDRLSYRSVLFGFPVWTFGVMAGAIWADHAWGRYWGMGPEGDLVVHHLGGLRDVPARQGYGGLARQPRCLDSPRGFLCLMFNVVGVNLLITGLHSYAGMP